MKYEKLYGLAGLAAVAVIGGTLAYYSASQEFHNPFETSNFSTYAYENFSVKNGSGWSPGLTVDKQVYAVNNGDGNVWVRVRLDETWTRGDGDTKKSIHDVIGSEDEKFNPEDTKTGYQASRTDGLTETDPGSVVYKKMVNVLDSGDDPKTRADSWYFLNGYYYYTSALEKDQSTVLLLDGVTLCNDTDMGLYDKVNAHIIVPKPEEGNKENQPVYPDDYKGAKWQPGKFVFDTSLRPGTEAYETAVQTLGLMGKEVFNYTGKELKTGYEGYAEADYELDVTVEFVQADQEVPTAFPDESQDWDWWPGK